MDIGGHATFSGQQIWTLTDGHGRSGNTLKVPGSRPGRPTIRVWTFTLVDPNGRNLYGIDNNTSPPTWLIDLPAQPVSLGVDAGCSERVGESLK